MSIELKGKTIDTDANGNLVNPQDWDQDVAKALALEGCKQGYRVRYTTAAEMLSVLFAALAWWCFQRRDIRVGGEGGWRLPWRKA